MNHIKRFLVIAAAGVALVLPSAAASAQDAGGASVSVLDNLFSPASLQLAAGDTLTWSFDGAAAHTVTADGGAFDSGTLNQGDGFSMMFDTPGTYAYYCNFHGAPGGVGMSGTITVS
jgi:plastocyanin